MLVKAKAQEIAKGEVKEVQELKQAHIQTQTLYEFLHIQFMHSLPQMLLQFKIEQKSIL